MLRRSQSLPRSRPALALVLAPRPPISKSVSPPFQTTITILRRNSSFLDVAKEKKFIPNKKERKERGHWEDPASQRAFLLDLGTRLGFPEGSLEAYYALSSLTLRKNGGYGLLTHHKYSMLNILRAAFPEHTWDPLKFGKVPQGYWKSPENQRRFLLEIGKKLGISEREYSKWYSINNSVLIKEGGAALLSLHNTSMIGLLQVALPEHIWDPTKFVKKPQNYWKSESNQREALTKIGIKLGIKEGEFEGWYKVDTKALAKQGGRSILAGHSSSISKMLLNLFPEQKWDPKRFHVKPKGYWKSLNNLTRETEEIGKLLGIKSLEDWYKVSHGDFIAKGGSQLLAHNENSLIILLKKVYEDFQFEESKFVHKSRSYWVKPENQRAFILDLGRILGIKTTEDWYRIKSSELIQNGGGPILALFDNSMAKLLSVIFTEIQWDPTRFSVKPKNFWTIQENKVAFMEKLGKKIGIESGDLSGWYKVGVSTMIENGGSRLLAGFNSSMQSLLGSIYSNHTWDPSKFIHKAKDYYTSSNIRSLLDEFGLKLGIQVGDFEPWYTVSTKDLLAVGAGPLLSAQNSSVSTLLQSAYPEHKWDPNLLFKRPHNFWKSIENQRSLLDSIGERLGFKKGDLEGWYSVGGAELYEHGAGTILVKYYNGSLHALFGTIYPEHTWHIWKFSKIRSGLVKDLTFFEDLIWYSEKKLGVTNSEDWKRISIRKLDDIGVRAVIESNGGLASVLRKVYPNLEWTEPSIV